MYPDDLVKLIEIHDELFELVRRENKRSANESEHLCGGVSYLEHGALPLIEQVIEYVKSQPVD